MLEATLTRCLPPAVVCQAAFAESFKDGSAFLQPVAQFLGLGGLMTAALGLATVVQFGFLLYDNTVAEDLAGFAPGTKSRPPIVTVFSSLSRTLAEGLPQLLLQGSLLMASGNGLLSQPLLLASLILSIVTSSKKSWEVTGAFAEWVRERGLPNGVAWVVVGGLGLCILSLWALLAFVALRIAMMQLCPCHSWGATTGCMPPVPP